MSKQIKTSKKATTKKQTVTKEVNEIISNNNMKNPSNTVPEFALLDTVVGRIDFSLKMARYIVLAMKKQAKRYPELDTTIDNLCSRFVINAVHDNAALYIQTNDDELITNNNIDALEANSTFVCNLKNAEMELLNVSTYKKDKIVVFNRDEFFQKIHQDGICDNDEKMLSFLQYMNKLSFTWSADGTGTGRLVPEWLNIIANEITIHTVEDITYCDITDCPYIEATAEETKEKLDESLCIQIDPEYTNNRNCGIIRLQEGDTLTYDFFDQVVNVIRKGQEDSELETVEDSDLADDLDEKQTTEFDIEQKPDSEKFDEVFSRFVPEDLLESFNRQEKFRKALGEENLKALKSAMDKSRKNCKCGCSKQDQEKQTCECKTECEEASEEDIKEIESLLGFKLPKGAKVLTIKGSYINEKDQEDEEE